jgi:thioredoxin-related protein
MQRPICAAAVLLALTSVALADDVPPVVSAAETGVAFEAGTPSFADVLAKAKAENKPAFIDFATEWCGWCKVLDKEVFSKAETAQVMKGFVNVHVDAEKGEGVELAKRFNVRGFPTLLIVDASGDEIDRVVGYMPAPAFNAEMGRVLRGDGTLPALRKASAAAPDDVRAGLKYAAKLAPGRPAESSALFVGLWAKAKSADRATQAEVLFEHAKVLLSSSEKTDHVLAADKAETLVKDYADTPAAAQAGRLARAFLMPGTDVARALAFLDGARAAAKTNEDRAGIEQAAVSVHKNAMAAALGRQAEAAGDDAQALNAVAWDCFEMKLNVKQALGWATTAVEKSERDPAILDTLANLLWLTGRHADAVKLETEAAEKTTDARMKKEFLGNVAKWNAELKLSKDAEDGPEDEDEGEEDEDDE